MKHSKYANNISKYSFDIYARFFEQGVDANNYNYIPIGTHTAYIEIEDDNFPTQVDIYRAIKAGNSTFKIKPEYTENVKTRSWIFTDDNINDFIRIYPPSPTQSTIDVVFINVRKI